MAITEHDCKSINAIQPRTLLTELCRGFQTRGQLTVTFGITPDSYQLGAAPKVEHPTDQGPIKLNVPGDSSPCIPLLGARLPCPISDSRLDRRYSIKCVFQLTIERPVERVNGHSRQHGTQANEHPSAGGTLQAPMIKAGQAST